MTTTPRLLSPEPWAWLSASLRRTIPLISALALWVTLPVAVFGQQPWRIGQRAAWINPISPDLQTPAASGTVTYGYELLQVDRQESVGAGKLERYRHLTYRLLNQSAVEELSQIELSVDPSYEQLTLHSARVIRDGKVIDQLKPSQIRVAQREGSRDYHIFNGSVSVILVLEGVRIGDLIEYSYTRSGSNPVFAGHYYAFLPLQEAVPVRDLHFRILWPASRQLDVHRYQTEAEPVITESGGRREYAWSAKDVPPKLVDDNIPYWYDAYPSVRLSDFTSWGQVAAWGDSLFSMPGPLPAPVKEQLTKIRADHSDGESRALAALRYAQEEVRYLGIEIGVNSHRPFPLATVIQRGYGDCKDKAQLLVAMLKDMGISAWPALVNTDLLQHVNDQHPSAVAFDHAIVQAEIDGKTVWLDPTDQYQRGDVRSVAPQFGAALVLGRGSDSLTPIPRVQEAEALTDVRVEFELGSIDKPVTMRVETDYRGRSAVSLRSTTHSNSLDRLQKDFTEYYAASYPGIEADGILTVEDNEATNVLHTSEHYRIPKFWHKSDDEMIGTFEPVELSGAVPKPVAAGRTMPLSVSFPIHYRYSLIVRLDEGWNIPDETDSLESPAMRFVRSVEAKDRELTIRYEYQTLADHVAPEAVADHLEKITRARRLLTFSVNPPRTSANAEAGLQSEGINWSVLITGIVVGLAAIAAVVVLSRSRPPSWARWPEPPTAGPSGLQGWLYLLGFGVTVTPVFLLYQLIGTFSAYRPSSWRILTTAVGPKYHALYGPLLMGELCFNIATIAFTALQAWFFFGRKRWFPILFVLLGLTRVGYGWIDILLATQIPALNEKGLQWEVHFRDTVVMLVWVLYMFRSIRVRNTFVN